MTPLEITFRMIKNYVEDNYSARIRWIQTLEDGDTSNIECRRLEDEIVREFEQKFEDQKNFPADLIVVHVLLTVINKVPEEKVLSALEYNTFSWQFPKSLTEFDIVKDRIENYLYKWFVTNSSLRKIGDDNGLSDDVYNELIQDLVDKFKIKYSKELNQVILKLYHDFRDLPF